MLCLVCQNVVKAPKIIAEETTAKNKRVYYNHHASVLDLENAIKQKCHLCVLIKKSFDDELNHGRIPMDGGKLQYWLECPDRSRKEPKFVLNLRLDNQYSGTLRILSPSRMPQVIVLSIML